MAFIAIILLYRWMPETLPPEKRHAIKISTIGHDYLTIIINKHFMLAALAFCTTFSAMITWIAMGHFLVINAFHYSPSMFGVFQVIAFGILIIGMHCVKIELQKFSVKKLITIAVCISLGGAILGLVFSLLFPHVLFYFIVTLMIFAFGNALSFGPLQRLAIDASQAPMGARMAILSSMMSASGTIGSLMAGYFYVGTTLSLACIAAISALLAVLCIRYNGINIKAT